MNRNYFDVYEKVMENGSKLRENTLYCLKTNYQFKLVLVKLRKNKAYLKSDDKKYIKNINWCINNLRQLLILDHI